MSQRFFFGFWPTDGQGSVLVTCRDILTNDSSLPYNRDSNHEVDTLPLPDAARFLRELVHVADSEESLKHSIGNSRSPRRNHTRNHTNGCNNAQEAFEFARILDRISKASAEVSLP